MVIIYDVAFAGASSGNLNSGARTRYGIVFEATSALLTKQIKTWTIQLKKNTGATGTVDAAIYDSGSSLISTAVESFDASTLSTTYGTNYTWTFTSARTIASGDHLVVRYAGATVISVRIHNTDQYDLGATRRTSWDGVSWISSSTDDVDGTITDGTFASNEDTHIYAVRNLAANQDTHIYAVRTKAANEDTHIYKIRTVASNQDTHIYKVRTLASNTLTSSYRILAPVAKGGVTSSKKRNRYRAYINNLARGLKDLFKIKQRPPPPEPVEIPPAQPPKTVTILPGPPTAETRLATLNDKWSIVASIPPPVARTEIIYPVILNPPNSPITTTKVSFPQATKQPYVPKATKADGSHIESWAAESILPQNRSKTASTLNTLMMLLEMERQV